MKTILLCCLLWLTSLTSLFAQSNGTQVSAFLSTCVIKLGAETELIVIVDGPSDVRLGELPVVDGMGIGAPGRPSVEVYTRYINGRRSAGQKTTWRIPVRPKRIGDFVLPPFKIIVGTDTYQSNPLRLSVREDLQGAELGWMQINVEPKALVDGQPFSVEIEFGWEVGLDQRINHVNLLLPWWDRLPGAIEIENPDKNLQGRLVKVQLNDMQELEVEALGIKEREGKSYVLYSTTRHFLATSPGTIEFPTSTLAFSRMTRGSLFEQPRAIESYYKNAPGMRLVAKALPEEGRPIEFSGAVGTIAASASASRREVDAGDSIKVEVTWTGDGNLEFFDLPDLSHAQGFEGFRFYGATDLEKGRNRRVAVFDLAPVDTNLTAIPPIPLTLYDPVADRYRTERTQPIPIRVHGLKGAGGLADLESSEPIDEIHDLMTDWQGVDTDVTRGARFRLMSRTGLWLLGSTLGLLVVAAFVRPRVRRGIDPAAPMERRRRRALGQLKKSLRGQPSATERHAAFCRFLAARQRTTEDAWHGRRFAGQRLALPADSAARADRVLEGLERAAWNGYAHAPDDAEMVATAEALIGGGL